MKGNQVNVNFMMLVDISFVLGECLKVRTYFYINQILEERLKMYQYEVENVGENI